MQINLPKWIIPLNDLVISKSTTEWCRIPYYNHLKGCPNYNKKTSCPPQASQLSEVFDFNKKFYLVYSEFNLKLHQIRMKRKHPEWSRNQCRCVLYWQPKSRKQLRERVEYAFSILDANYATSCPEAMGLNVYATAIKHGLKLERIKNLRICRHVALLGRRREK